MNDLLVDFDDEIDDDMGWLDPMGNLWIPDQRGGGGRLMPVVLDSVKSDSINTGFNSGLTGITSKWVLGVRHVPHMTSHSLNHRMHLKATKQFDSNVFNSNVVTNSGSVSKRDSQSSRAHPMDDIEEETSDRSVETFHSHRNTNAVDYRKTNKIDKSVMDQMVIDNRAAKERCEKSVKNTHNKSKTSNNNWMTKIASTDTPNVIIDVYDKRSNCDNIKTNNNTNNYNISKNISFSSMNYPTDVSKVISPNNKLNTNYKRCVNSVPLTTQQELKRFKSQRFCELVSLITIIFGLILVTVTPFLLIPIWVIPNPYSPLIRNFLWLSLLVCIMLLTMAALTGNIYWYYDEESQKWKWFYHCGKGPEDHYWGATLLHKHKPSKFVNRKVKTHNNIVFNV